MFNLLKTFLLWTINNCSIMSKLMGNFASLNLSLPSICLKAHGMPSSLCLHFLLFISIVIINRDSTTRISIHLGLVRLFDVSMLQLGDLSVYLFLWVRVSFIVQSSIYGWRPTYFVCIFFPFHWNYCIFSGVIDIRNKITLMYMYLGIFCLKSKIIIFGCSF